MTPVLWDKIDPISDNFDTVVIGTGDNHRYYRIYGGGLETQAQELKNQFPQETHDAIDEYYSLVEKAAGAFENGGILKALPLWMTRFLRLTGLHRFVAKDFTKYASQTVEEVVISLTDNEDLRCVLTYNWLCYGCEPSRAPFALHACVFDVSSYLW